MDIDESTIGLVLIVIGILMLVLEASSPGFFIAIPGTVVLILGMIGIIAPDLFFTWVSPVVALLISLPITIVAIKFYQKLAPPEAPTTTVGTSLIGRQGTVTVEIKPKQISGKVQVENQSWSATASTVIPAGTEVIILESRGVHVLVEPVEERRK
ncbi:MAG: NfeD family protein [Candidatus Thermoplasmatota archaeon]|nr:NfeD family protein [Euryarchaeota archaeon]MBU4032012.1 NfeD family protein [Candidatus Thermoplasmatota archaeon]MBU4071790.1 NfeD family protein [Candidatus Thermoplasmatota archaeon]MBU4143899.1 NfeD family protein [Candidatus Thermoplasmatota archaeon]MBU4592492.1 NfeD family protein [Candidatus Thermoplasmatota archaeon]